MSSPWAKIPTPEPVNFADILSEEIAKEIQSKKDKKYAEKVLQELKENEGFKSSDPPPILCTDENVVRKSDELLAKMLQSQYDLGNDDKLKKTESKFNGDSKESIPFSNDGSAQEQEDGDSEELLLEDPNEKRDWDRFDDAVRQLNIIPTCGYTVKGDRPMVNKHDIVMSGKRNTYKMITPDSHSDDGAGVDLQMPNKVFNDLNIYSSKEEARIQHMKDKKEDYVAAEFESDQYTHLLLSKIINYHILKNITGVVGAGKEAVVLHAESDPSYPDVVLPKECAVKIYKTVSSEEGDQYIKNDLLFNERTGKQTMRKTIYLRAEKEMHNLNRLKRAGIPCPEVIYLKHHVLVMTFIGENQKPARKLKYKKLKDSEYEDAYHQVTENMKKLYQKANLIHGDLSEYNILWFKGKCYFIDVGQSIVPNDISLFGFLMKDCENICKFFKSNGVHVIKPGQLFFDITGCEFTDRLGLEALVSTYKANHHLTNHDDIKAPLIDKLKEVKSQELAKSRSSLR